MDDIKNLLDTVRQQEETLHFREFTNDTAYAVGQRLVALARQANKSVTIDICRNGQQLFHVALSGTSADNDSWIIRKNRVVARFGHSSYFMRLAYLARDTTFEAKTQLDPLEYAAHGGAFPIIIKNVGPVGTITVSGLPQEEDHQLVVQVITEFVEAQRG